MSDREELRKEIARLEADNKRLEEIIEREMRKMAELKVEQGKVFKSMQEDRDRWLNKANSVEGSLLKLQQDYANLACTWKTCPIRRHP